MRVWASAEVLSDREMKAIDVTARRILAEIGVKVEHERVRGKLKEVGGVEGDDEKMFFPQDVLTAFLEGIERFDWEKDEVYDPRLGFGAGAYPQRWHDPDEDAIKLQTIESVSKLTRLADRLENISSIGAMGVPSDVPSLLAPLYMRLIAWRDAAHTAAARAVCHRNGGSDGRAPRRRRERLHEGGRVHDKPAAVCPRSMPTVP